MLTIQLEGDKELVAKLKTMPDKVRQALYAKCWTLSEMLNNYIIGSKLSGQVLNHKSGDLWRSIHHSAEQSDSAVSGRVLSEGVRYAAIHEFGGYIPAHVIEAKNGEALSFLFNGKQAFFKKVNWPGATMPERSYMRSALADKQPEIVEGLTQAVQQGIQ